MRAALETCGEFLSRIGALEGANAIADILRKTGQDLPESSPFRWRALLAAVRQELDADPMDAVFLFERLVQLQASLPSRPSHALFGSPLFLHLLVERFAVAFEGLDAELFKLESDELCHAEGIFETCQLISDKIEENQSESELKKFLAAFERIFAQDEPKDCWDAFYELHHLNDSSFRRDMKRALCMIETVTLGPTKLEIAFPTEAEQGPKKIVPRALLEKRFGGTRREWRDLSQINSISEAAINQANEEQEPEQPSHNDNAEDAVNEDVASVHSDISEVKAPAERPVTSRPPRAAQVARTARQEGRRSVPRPQTPTEIDNAEASGHQAVRRKRVRWSAEEEAALIEGYRLYEAYSNVWVLIKTKFPDVLQNRSNVDLKDKYRNLVKYGKIPLGNDGNETAGATDNDATDGDAMDG